MSETAPNHELLRLSTQIVAAHIGHNEVVAEAVPEIIRSVYAALSKVGAPTPEAAWHEPAVPIKKSVFPDYIVCLEDGQKLRTLKRYIQKRYGMTPDDYRAKWHLPPDYPMVAPDYAAHRSKLAKESGLGRRIQSDETNEVVVQKIAAGVRGKKRKTEKADPQSVD